MAERGHIPVLPEEVLGALSPGSGQTYVDCTAGLGGHAVLVARRLGPGGCIILNDSDPENLAHAMRRVEAAALGVSVRGFHGNFAELPARLAETGLRADMVLADLGFSSNQVEDAGRGFSFSRSGPLDMRMDPTLSTTARDLVNGLPEDELAGILREFGEERHARSIARKLVRARATEPIDTSVRLAEVVRSACPPGGPIDPATRTFQALRIAVNDEIGSLEALLASIARGARESQRGGWLRPGARVSIISFHSLEDRPVKHVFGEMAREGLAEPVNNNVVIAGEAEVAANPRARSAKLRAVRLV